MNDGIKCASDTGSGARSTWGQACGAAAQNTTASHPACRRPLPAAGILGEEGAARESRGPYRVVLDPIDGTAAFVAGLATWCVCIGILEDARPVAGVVHLPCLGETYSAVGGAAWLNGVPLASLGAAAPVGDRFIVAHAHAHRRHRITYPGKVRSLGSTAYH